MIRYSFRVVVGLCCFFLGCSKAESPIETQPNGDSFTIDAVDYATNYFFVDTSYQAIFYQLTSMPPGTMTYEGGISLESVWIERLPNELKDPDEITCKAILDLPYWAPGRYDQYRNLADKEGEIESGTFVRLSRDKYSVPMSGAPGLIALRTAVSENRAIGVSCLTSKGYIGEYPWGVTLDSTIMNRNLVIKLIRPRALMSTGVPWMAWRLLFKNVYRTGFRNIERRDFHLEITYKRPGSSATPTLLGHNLLNLLGLDVLDHNGQAASGGDGEFDFVAGRTIDPEHGEIILPGIAPFQWGIQDALNHNGQYTSDTSAYLLRALYDTTRAVAAASLRGVYTISGRAVHY